METPITQSHLVVPPRTVGGATTHGQASNSKGLAKFRRPAPSYRHGTPSGMFRRLRCSIRELKPTTQGPWPFLDTGDEVSFRSGAAEQQRLPVPPHWPRLVR
jgi:hypothetical protein